MRILRDLVLVRPWKKAKISDIIELTEDTTAKPQPYGTVMACGPLVEEIAPGDIVHFQNFDWNKAPHDCIIIEEGEILAKQVK